MILRSYIYSQRVDIAQIPVDEYKWRQKLYCDGLQLRVDQIYISGEHATIEYQQIALLFVWSLPFRKERIKIWKVSYKTSFV